MSISREPQKLKVLTKPPTMDGWWYENRHSIDIVVEIDTGTIAGRKTGQVRITRRQIKNWLQRTKP